MHEASLVATLAFGFGLALLLGFAAAKVRIPPLVGYLVAGILIGPHTRGFVGDVALAGQLAEVGVILLMFGIGLHFSFDDLATVRHVVLAGAAIQVTLVAAAGAAVAMAWHWPAGAAIVFGLCLSVSSTVVLLRSLESQRLQATFDGRFALAWLVVQDLIMVLVLVLLPAVAPGAAGAATSAGILQALVLTALKVIAFIALMFFGGRRLFPLLLWVVAKTGSRELFTVCVIAAAVGVAYGSARLFGVSFALGAFFAGMMLRESPLSHRAARESLPLRDAFAVLFFLSVGMLFDPMVLLREPGRVIVVVLLIVLANGTVAAVIVKAFRYPLRSALTVAAALTQIGEFSFVLATLGISLGLLSTEGQNLVLAGSIVTIAVNPMLLAIARSAATRVGPHTSAGDQLAELPMTIGPAELTGHVLLVGYGRVGRRIAASLAKSHIPFVVIEESRELVQELRSRKVAAVAGDATEPEVLIQGHVARARMLVIAIPGPPQIRKIIETARAVNPSIELVVRTHSDDESDLLRRDEVGAVFMGEHELAAGMSRFIVERMTTEASE